MCSWNQTTWTETAIVRVCLVSDCVAVRFTAHWFFLALLKHDRRRRGIEHETWMACSPSPSSLSPSASVVPSNKKQRTDEQTNMDAAASQKPTGKGKGGNVEATPPSHGRSGLGIHRTTHVARCSPAPNLGGLVEMDTFLLPCASQTATSMKQAVTSIPGKRFDERVGRPTSRAGRTTRTRLSSHGRITGDSDAGHESRAGPAHDSEPAGTVDEHRHSPADGSWDHDGASLQNQARGGHKTPVPSPGRNRSVGPQSRTMHHRSATHGGHRPTEPS